MVDVESNFWGPSDVTSLLRTLSRWFLNGLQNRKTCITNILIFNPLKMPIFNPLVPVIKSTVYCKRIWGFLFVLGVFLFVLGVFLHIRKLIQR